jgi:hypothetical protein
MSEDTYLRSNIIGAIEDTCHGFMSSTVNVAYINKRSLREQESGPRVRLSTGSIFRSYKKRFTKSHVRCNQMRGHGCKYTNEVLGSSLIVYVA